MPAKILLIDDEPSVLKSLRRALLNGGYEILTAGSGPEALEIVAEHEVALIICDQRMPGMTGAETLAESVKLRPDAIRITLTGCKDVDSAAACINQGGISQFLRKPWDDAHLRTVVRQGIGQYEMKQEIRRLHEVTRKQRDELQEWNQTLEQKVLERTEALSLAHEETLNAMVLALDSREHSTGGHSRRVAVFFLYLALEVGIPAEDLENLYRGALLHDIGKIGIPDAVLLKPGPLDAKERRIIEQHVSIGVRFLEQVGFLEQATAIPRYHHEWYDGTGYCEQLAGEDIPIEARTFAVVDVYDALTNHRPYKQAVSHEKAVEIISSESGTHLDPNVARVFLTIPSMTWTALAASAEQPGRFPDLLALCRRIQADAIKPAPRALSMSSLSTAQGRCTGFEEAAE